MQLILVVSQLTPTSVSSFFWYSLLAWKWRALHLGRWLDDEDDKGVYGNEGVESKRFLCISNHYFRLVQSDDIVLLVASLTRASSPSL